MIVNKVQNIKRNIIFGIINKIIMMLCPFAIRTIIIWKLGVEYVGLSSLFTSILQILSLAELGFGTAIVYSMYKPLAENDTKLISALLNLYRKVYRIIGLVILSIGIMLMPFLKFLIWGNYPSDINIYILFIIYLINTVLSYFLFAYKQSLLLANQRNDVESNITSISYLIMYILQIVAIIFTKNYYCYIIFLPFCTIAINLIRNEYIKKKYPKYICSGELPIDVKKDMKKRIFGLMLSRICQVCRNSFDSIVISMALGLTILGKYQNYYYIINTIAGFLTIITTSIVAGIGNNIVTKTKEENYEEFKLFQFGYNWIASWCTVCLLCLYQPFMEIWVGKNNLMPFWLVMLMCIYFYVLRVGDVVAVYKEATGIYWEDRYRPVLESIVNLVLNFALVYTLGVYGVVLSTIISILFINIPWAAIVLHKTYFRISSIKYFSNVGINILILIFISIVTYKICLLFNGNNLYINLIIRGVICIFIPNVILVLVNYKNHNLRKSLKFIKRMF
ncbi:MAG: polysaccharide biosynthesis protein [Clostridia bacterium]|nr:polysaccharide biosynthesis protein [Clostridia bacterium]